MVDRTREENRIEIGRVFDRYATPERLGQASTSILEILLQFQEVLFIEVPTEVGTGYRGRRHYGKLKHDPPPVRFHDSREDSDGKPLTVKWPRQVMEHI